VAEVNGQQSQVGQGVAQPENGQASNNQQQTCQDSEPRWLSYIPESERKEAREGWLRDADYRKKTMEIGERERTWETEKQSLAEKAAQADQFTKWYQESYTPFYNQINSKWEDIQKVLTGQPATAPQTNGNQQQDYFANYDLLPPTEQAKRQAEYIQNNYLAQALQAQKQEFTQNLQQEKGYFTNFLNILVDAFDRKSNDPSLDLRAFLTEANNFQQGKGNPLELAYAKVTSETSRKALEDQWYKKGKEEALLEMQNQQQSNGALNDRGVPVFKVQARTKAQIEDAARDAARKANISW
jgi:hypothetical protein